MTRREICDELARAGCTAVGFEWNTDELVERAWSLWKTQGSPRCAVVTVERDRADGREVVFVTAPQGASEVERHEPQQQEELYPVLE